MTGANRNESELLFEEYLTTHGYAEWTHEVPVEGKRRNPDYRLEHDRSSLVFEVKEFDAAMPTMRFGTYDPYGPIREKINQATRQFKEYKDSSCSLVLPSGMTPVNEIKAEEIRGVLYLDTTKKGQIDGVRVFFV